MACSEDGEACNAFAASINAGLYWLFLKYASLLCKLRVSRLLSVLALSCCLQPCNAATKKMRSKSRRG